MGVKLHIVFASSKKEGTLLNEHVTFFFYDNHAHAGGLE